MTTVAVRGGDCQLGWLVFHPECASGSVTLGPVGQCLVGREGGEGRRVVVHWRLCCSDLIGKESFRGIFPRLTLPQ